jgi:hypothetical protein
MTTATALKRRGDWPTEDAKGLVLDYIEDGDLTIEAIMVIVGRTVRTYELWRQHDPIFRANVEKIRAARKIKPDVVTAQTSPGPSQLPSGICHACNRVALLVQGPRGDLRCVECAGAPAQQARAGVL